MQRTQESKTALKKNKVGGLKLPDIKTDDKPISIKTAKSWHWDRIDQWHNRGSSK